MMAKKKKKKKRKTNKQTDAGKQTNETSLEKQIEQKLK